MDVTDAIAADELWGWPVDVLDQLVGLRTRAWDGAISLEEWRQQDAAVRVGRPAVDVAAVQELEKHAISDRRGVPIQEIGRLLDRLTVLVEEPFTDEDLWDELADATESLNGPNRSPRSEGFHRDRRDRVVAWLTRPGGGVDPVSGLRWSEVARYRFANHPDLGPVPQYVDVARQLATRGASTVDRRRASMISEERGRAAMRSVSGELDQKRLTYFPSMLLAAAHQDDETFLLVTGLLRVWKDARTQQLLVLETSRGWPEPLAVISLSGCDVVE